MNHKERKRISKYLSLHLRHQPERLGLQLEPGGWVSVEELLDCCSTHGFVITREQLEAVVETNDKKRFAFDETGEKIRANQGHSIEVDLQLKPESPPEQLYHGTADHNLQSILSNGIQKRQRHHVHLSGTKETAHQVGSRHGRSVILTIDSGRMAQDGHVFYQSANGVWLVEEIPPAYIHVDSDKEQV